MSKDLGDFKEDAIFDFKFSTKSLTQVPTSLLGSPVIKIYKDDETGTESTAGITLTVDFDGVTGLNNVHVDLSSDAFYAIGSNYQAVITTGTVDGISVVSSVVRDFSIENRFDEVDVTKLGGVAQSLDDLKDFADAGYDPVTNKVQGVVLVDTSTANSDMRGTNSANTVIPPTVSEMNARTLPSADYLVEGDTLARVTLVDTCTTNSDMVSAAPTVNEMINTAQTEDYAAQGATGSITQLLYMIWSLLKSVRNVNTTTPDSLGIDDSTVKMSFLTDSASTPTEMKRT